MAPLEELQAAKAVIDTLFLASTTTHFLSTVFLFAEIVLKLIVSKIQFFKFPSLKRACKSTIIYFISKQIKNFFFLKDL